MDPTEHLKHYQKLETIGLKLLAASIYFGGITGFQKAVRELVDNKRYRQEEIALLFLPDPKKYLFGQRWKFILDLLAEMKEPRERFFERCISAGVLRSEDLKDLQRFFEAAT
jgi:hypothetical protein